jgi:hypothetical protein
MASRDPVADDHVVDTERHADVDVRMRPVVLDTGALRRATRKRGQAARAVLGVAIATVLAAGAVAAGSWSIMTAAAGGTPANEPASLWYATPPPPDAGDSRGATEPSPVAPPPNRIIVPGPARQSLAGRGPGASATG